MAEASHQRSDDIVYAAVTFDQYHAVVECKGQALLVGVRTKFGIGHQKRKLADFPAIGKHIKCPAGGFVDLGHNYRLGKPDQQATGLTDGFLCRFGIGGIFTDYSPLLNYVNCHRHTRLLWNMVKTRVNYGKRDSPGGLTGKVSRRIDAPDKGGNYLNICPGEFPGQTGSHLHTILCRILGPNHQDGFLTLIREFAPYIQKRGRIVQLKKQSWVIIVESGK